MKEHLHLSDQERQALMMFKEHLQKCLGENLQQISIFGSRARGEGTESSDLDVAVIVKRDDGTIRRTVYDEAADLSIAIRHQ